MINCDNCAAPMDTPRPRSQSRRKCSRCMQAQQPRNANHARYQVDHLWYAPYDLRGHTMTWWGRA